jgi:hypothetical protein
MSRDSGEFDIIRNIDLVVAVKRLKAAIGWVQVELFLDSRWVLCHICALLASHQCV